MMEMTKVNDLYSEWLTGDGVFTDLNEFDVPWKPTDPNEDDTPTVTALNMAYHGNHSGEKNVSPIVYKFIKEEVSTPREKLAQILVTMYLDKWARLWNSFVIGEYNPLSNYDMTERETPAEVTHTTTPAETTETLTPAETTLETKPAKTVTENDVSAFNSSTYQDAEKTTVAGDPTDKGSEVLTVNSSGSTKLQVDTAGSDVLTVQNERTLTRSGNIGVTTSQQMLQSEIELRKYNFFLSVFNDIDTVLTLSIY